MSIWIFKSLYGGVRYSFEKFCIFQKNLRFEFSLFFEPQIFLLYFFLFFNLKAVKIIYNMELKY